MLFAPGCSIANHTIYTKEQINTLINYLPRKLEIVFELVNAYSSDFRRGEYLTADREVDLLEQSTTLRIFQRPLVHVRGCQKWRFKSSTVKPPTWSYEPQGSVPSSGCLCTLVTWGNGRKCPVAKENTSQSLISQMSWVSNHPQVPRAVRTIETSPFWRPNV